MRHLAQGILKSLLIDLLETKRDIKKNYVKFFASFCPDLSNGDVKVELQDCYTRLIMF